MKKILYALLFLFSQHLAYGRQPVLNAPVYFPKQDSAQKLIPENNYQDILFKSNERLFSNVIAFYNQFAAKSLKKGSPRQAEEMLLKKSIPLSIRYGDHRNIYDCFMALAECYVEQKKYTQAKWYFIQSNISAQKAKYPKGEVLALIQLSKLKRIIGDDLLAYEDIKQAEKIALEHNFKSTLPGIKKILNTFPQSDKKATETVIETAEKQVLAN